MNKIDADIKNHDFKPIYLIYGEEDYLKLLKRNELIKAIVGDNTMSLTIYNEKIDAEEIVSVGETMPFMSEYRLIVFDRCEVCKLKDEKFINFIKDMPDYLKIVIIENSVDKRMTLYKIAAKNGYVCEAKPLTENAVITFIQDECKRNGKKISKEAAREICIRCNGNLSMIKCELEKLYAYTIDRDDINEEDVNKICSVSIEEKVFDMIAAFAERDGRQAMRLYYDLLAVKEPPMKILILMERHFNGIYQAKCSPPMPAAELAKTIGMKGVMPFVAGKYLKQANHFSTEKLRRLAESFAEAEEDIKTGRMTDKTALELMLAECLMS